LARIDTFSSLFGLQATNQEQQHQLINYLYTECYETNYCGIVILGITNASRFNAKRTMDFEDGGRIKALKLFPLLHSGLQAKLHVDSVSAFKYLRGVEADHDFLLKGNVFTEDVIETWVSYKMENEVQELKLRPHPYEFAMYFDI